MNGNFRPLGCGIGLRVDRQPATTSASISISIDENEDDDMSVQRGNIPHMLLSAIDDAGGLISAVALRDACPGVNAASRRKGMQALRRQGLVESEGSTTQVIYSITPRGIRQLTGEGEVPTASSVAPGQAAESPEPEPTSAIPPREWVPASPRQPMALQERVASVLQDLDEVLLDAATAHLSHELLIELMVGRAAIDRAARLLRH